jgi:hypothetical protein
MHGSSDGQRVVFGVDFTQPRQERCNGDADAADGKEDVKPGHADLSVRRTKTKLTRADQPQDLVILLD